MKNIIAVLFVVLFCQVAYSGIIIFKNDTGRAIERTVSDKGQHGGLEGYTTVQIKDDSEFLKIPLCYLLKDTKTGKVREMTKEEKGVVDANLERKREIENETYYLQLELDKEQTKLKYGFQVSNSTASLKTQVDVLKAEKETLK